MGNGALPNGPSYRAHPRLYRLGHRATALRVPLAMAKRKCFGKRRRTGFDPRHLRTALDHCFRSIRASISRGRDPPHRRDKYDSPIDAMIAHAAPPAKNLAEGT